jgi:hypothetical protein
MRTELDIPDTKYDRLAAKAEQEGTSVVDIVLRGIDKELESEVVTPKPAKRLKHPTIPSTRTDKLVISNEQIYDLDSFPLPRMSEPILKSYAPGSIDIDNERIYDLIGFP